MVVYGDLLFVLNLLLDYGLLLATARIAGAPFVRLRLMMGAVFGAMYALLVFVPGLQFLSVLPMRFLMGAVMVMIAYGARRSALRLMVVFGAVSAALGGGVLALTTVGSATLYRGIVTTGADLVAVLLTGSLGCMLLGVLFRRGASKLRHRDYADVEVALGGRTTSFRALVDTGNALTDRTNHRVIVADWEVVREVLPGLTYQDVCSPGLGFQKLTGLLPPSRVRLLSYRTVGVSDGLLLAVRPDRIVVNGKTRPGLLVAASAHPVSDGGLYRALIGAEEMGGMV